MSFSLHVCHTSLAGRRVFFVGRREVVSVSDTRYRNVVFIIIKCLDIIIIIIVVFVVVVAIIIMICVFKGPETLLTK